MQIYKDNLKNLLWEKISPRVAANPSNGSRSVEGFDGFDGPATCEDALQDELVDTTGEYTLPDRLVSLSVSEWLHSAWSSKNCDMFEVARKSCKIGMKSDWKCRTYLVCKA